MMIMEGQMMTDQQVIEQLSNYKRMAARIRLLENYSAGDGIKVSRFGEDDQLQELHRQLRKMPSYMYLTKREQELEATAHAYLTSRPAGTRAQLAAIPAHAEDPDDERKLREIRSKIEKIIEARGEEKTGIDALLDRLAELQDLQAKVKQVDDVLDALASYKPEYAKLLRLRYIEDMQAGEVAEQLGVVRRTFERWQPKAIAEYRKLASMSP
ncbi:ECF-type sigma factor [Paenibacillus sp. 32O-W]|uniref:ECF-type sigma factor n=1 Tax=Paenibacillus sp. 32O-W TaxID=1695218 RepID=UPI001F258271|nr:ECF-type sigma factor [Paenibacillus sp. 32O-W]